MDTQEKLRDLQDAIANRGWRIKLLSSTPKGKIILNKGDNWAGYLAAIAIFGFPIGLGLSIYHLKHQQSPFPGIIIAVVSWALCGIGLVMRSFLKKKNWILVQAKCMDTEIQRVMVRKGLNWEARILCEFIHGGSSSQCTPTVHWSSFRSEEAASHFLKSRISSDGTCMLKVNPNNLLEADLLRLPPDSSR